VIEMQHQNSARLRVLDGWRGISILCVLAGHLIPLSPKVMQLNGMVATTGMSLFFILSGFLIVSMLNRNTNVASFLVRRIFRIVPLAWGFLIVVLWFGNANLAAWEGNLMFYANLPPFYLDYHNAHFWSLSLEMQFYAAIALAVGLLGRRGLLLVPVVCLAVTATRIAYGKEASIITWWRVDEILAGGCLALAFASPTLVKLVLTRLPPAAPFLIAPLLLASCHPASGPLNYARPYFAALLIGSTLLRRQDFLNRLLCGRILGYLAIISFALYVIHPLTVAGWMGQGDITIRYSKRLASILITFLFAHLSTNYFEKYWIDLGHRMARLIEERSWQISRKEVPTEKSPSKRHNLRRTTS
jgi:peptidoglycan/LPS O-acetylase OafA/YrhL